jgi:methionyl aminopeptidase
MGKDADRVFTRISPEARVMTQWIKTEREIEGMRRAGRFNARLMDAVRSRVKPGVSTERIDDWIREFTLDHGHTPACMNYRGYPKNSCISVNEVVCHGVPSPDIVLKEGDIVNIDLTTIVEGFFGDQSETFLVGAVSPETRKLVVAAGNALVEGIQTVREGIPFARIGESIEDYIRPLGYSVVVDYTGHGIGRRFHEEPPIYHFRNNETANYLMAPGMTFTVEPMINAGTWRVEVDSRDRWTVRTLDRKPSAQFEHTVLVTPRGVEILTLTEMQADAGKICLLSDHERNTPGSETSLSG